MGLNLNMGKTCLPSHDDYIIDFNFKLQFGRLFDISTDSLSFSFFFLSNWLNNKILLELN